MNSVVEKDPTEDQNIQKTLNCGPEYLFFSMSTNDPRLGTNTLSNQQFSFKFSKDRAERSVEVINKEMISALNISPRREISTED